MFHHEVDFYSDDSSLIKRLSLHMASELHGGNAAMVVATEKHRVELARELRRLGYDSKKAWEEGRYVSLDAAETLAEMVVDLKLDFVRFGKQLGGLIGEVASRVDAGHVAIFGEMVALLVAEGKGSEAIRLEQLWNALGRELPFSLRCAYPMSNFANPESNQLFLQVCGEHSSTYSQ